MLKGNIFTCMLHKSGMESQGWVLGLSTFCQNIYAAITQSLDPVHFMATCMWGLIILSTAKLVFFFSPKLTSVEGVFCDRQTNAGDDLPIHQKHTRPNVFMLKF